MTSLRLKYQTIEFGKTDIHVCGLRNKQEFSDPQGIAEKFGISSSHWPIFGLLWPSSIVLANYLLEFDTENKRILEVGCGLALSSLLLNNQGNDITATDHHPEVDRFLKRNTSLNNDPDIPFERVDWADKKDSLGLYDLIIGSDLLYEDEHTELLGNFFNDHAQNACEIILVDPSRGRKNKLIQKLASFGFKSSTIKVKASAKLPDDYKGFILSFKR